MFNFGKMSLEMQIFIAIVVLYLLKQYSDSYIKNSGVANGVKKMGMTNSSNVAPTSNNMTVQKDGMGHIIGSNGNLLANVPSGVSTRTVEQRLNAPKTGYGWDSKKLLPNQTSGFDSISPIEFAKDQNFLEPQKMIGTVLDSNKNAN